MNCIQDQQDKWPVMFASCSLNINSSGSCTPGKNCPDAVAADLMCMILVNRQVPLGYFSPSCWTTQSPIYVVMHAED